MDKKARSKSLETLCLLAAVLGGIGLYSGSRLPGLAALALLLCGLFLPRAAARISDAWLGFSKILGELNSRLILTLIFYLVLTPVALLRRLFSKEARAAGWRAEGSYYHERGYKYSKRDFEKLW